MIQLRSVAGAYDHPLNELRGWYQIANTGNCAGIHNAHCARLCYEFFSDDFVAAVNRKGYL